jgi:ribosomal protein S18 acetylase RimI-like enzyme
MNLHQVAPPTDCATIAPADADRAIATLTLAFSADPAARWAFPDTHDYLTHFPNIVRGFGGNAFAQGTGHQVDGFAGVALWLPPGVHPDEEALGAAVQNGVAAERQAAVFAVFERMASYHPKEPHWFLPLIGVDPRCRRRGYGSMLLQHVLAQCDRDRVPAYLESSNPANIPLYERHGFVALGEIQEGASPTIVPMLRKPR